MRRAFVWSLLLGIPIVLLLEHFELSESYPGVVFVLSALSLVPLASLLESAVEELSELLGQFVGGLLHTTFGNVAELAIGVSILLSGLSGGADIVRASIAGAIIRNSLLFLGLATAAGCWRHGRMKFNSDNASEYSTVLALAVIGIALPTVGALIFGNRFSDKTILTASMALAVVLLVSYVAYVAFAVFRVAEGRDLVAVRRQKREDRVRRHVERQRARASAKQGWQLPLPAQPDVNALFAEERATAEARLESETAAAPGPAAAARAKPSRIDPKGARAEARHKAREEQGEGERGLFAGHPILRGLAAVVVLAVAAAFVVLMSEQFVHTIEPVASRFLGGNELFVGLVVIPVIGGVVELNGAVGEALENRMEVTMAVTAGASIQMILVVAPVLVFVGAFNGTPFDLVFQPLAVAVFVGSMFVFMLLGRDGESNWLEGIQLVAFWVLFAATAFFLGAGG
jgi:Ca2+:H+ antiporter